MAERNTSEARFAKLGIAILGFAALAVMFSGAGSAPGALGAPDPNDQLAQVFNVPPPEIPGAEPAAQPTAEQVVSRTNVACETALPDNLPADHYLRRQLIQNVGGAESLCGVNADGSVVIAGSVSGTCPAYPGPSGEGATPQCPTAVVYRDPGQDDYMICWNIGTSSRCPAQTSQNNEGTGDTPSEETAGDRLDAVADSLADNTPTDTSTELGLSSDGLSIYDPVSDQYIDLADYGFTESWSDQGFEGWIAPDGSFYSESELREMFPGPSGPDGAASFQNASFQGTEGRYIETGGAGGSYAGSVSDTPSPNVTDSPPTARPTPSVPGGGAPAPTPDATPTSPAPPPVGNPNPVAPVTPGDGGVPGVTGGGVYESPGYNFDGSGSDFGNTGGGNPYSWQEPRYRSLETPQERILRERLRSHFGGSREPSIVDRFAQLIGADSLPVIRNSPQGAPGEQPRAQVVPATPAQQRFIIRATDAHYRSIAQIANDVATNDIPANSRVDHYARALRVIGGPDTNRRATTTNPALASLQDLIVEDEAIRSMFVAEQTAEREKNKIFCRDGEESVDCQQRREAVAKQVERETFVTELQKRELPDNAVQHFLAVYDGWVSPNVPVPASNPLLLADAPAASAVPEAGTDDATAENTTNDGFVSWALGGVRDSAARMFEALRTWLAP